MSTPVAARRGGFGAVFARGEFRWLWLADVQSLLGDQLARVALTVLVYERTRSGLASAAVYAATFVPALAGDILLGFLAERSGNTYRVVFTASVTMLAQLAAAWLLSSGHAGMHALHNGVLAGLLVASAVPLFVLVNLTLLVCGMWLAARPPSVRALVPGLDTLANEAGGLLLGILAAELLVHSPVLLPVTLVFVAALQRSAAVKALHETARTDAKTGLLTAGAWTASAQSLLARLHRAGSGDIAVMLVDLDHFKAINDEHGHLIGDKVLAAVGACLQRELRDRDAVGRFGGEEFAAVLAGAAASEAAVVAERICAAIRDINVADVVVTASVGVAHHDVAGSDDTLEALLARADSALYAAKRQGRNQARVRTGAVRR